MSDFNYRCKYCGHSENLEITPPPWPFKSLSVEIILPGFCVQVNGKNGWPSIQGPADPDKKRAVDMWNDGIRGIA